MNKEIPSSNSEDETKSGLRLFLLTEMTEEELAKLSMKEAIQFIGRELNYETLPKNLNECDELLRDAGFDPEETDLIALRERLPEKVMNADFNAPNWIAMEAEKGHTPTLYALPMRYMYFLDDILQEAKESGTVLQRLLRYEHAEFNDAARQSSQNNIILGFHRTLDLISDGMPAIVAVEDILRSLERWIDLERGKLDAAAIVKAIKNRLPSEKDIEASKLEGDRLIAEAKVQDWQIESRKAGEISVMEVTDNDARQRNTFVEMVSKYIESLCDNKSFAEFKYLNSPETFDTYLHWDEATSRFTLSMRSAINLRLEELKNHSEDASFLVIEIKYLVSLLHNHVQSKGSVVEWWQRSHFESLMDVLGIAEAVYIHLWAKMFAHKDFKESGVRLQDGILIAASNWVEYIYRDLTDMESSIDLREQVSGSTGILNKQGIYALGGQIVKDSLREFFSITISDEQFEEYLRNLDSN